MSVLGNCPKCGRAYGDKRRCYTCQPGRRKKEAVVLTPDEVESRKAELCTKPTEWPEEMRVDKRELLRRAMAERAAREREKVREERAGFVSSPVAKDELVAVDVGPRVAVDVKPRGLPANRVVLDEVDRIDPEIQAIALVHATLNQLDEKARDRALVYLRERFSCGF